jgi:GTP cyclohydrolase II
VFCLADEPLLEHVAMLAGDVRGDDVLTRVHSECITSEVFGSLRCDCRERLHLALARIAAEGRGVVVYRRRALGLPDQARRYDAAASLLNELGVSSVRLLSNDPAPISELEALGVSVRGRVPLTVRARVESSAQREPTPLRPQHLP